VRLNTTAFGYWRFPFASITPNLRIKSLSPVLRNSTLNFGGFDPGREAVSAYMDICSPSTASPQFGALDCFATVEPDRINELVNMSATNALLNPLREFIEKAPLQARAILIQF
jgi:hypothetical protein